MTSGQRFAHTAMRTGWELVIADRDREPSSARAIAEEVFAEIDTIEALLSGFRPASDLGRINAAAGTGPVKVDARVVDFLLRARDLVEATGGAFDPTVGPVMNLLRGRDPPAAAALAAARERIGFRAQVSIDEAHGTVGLRQAGARLDPGALGKGYALDRAHALLIDLGVRAAILHAGTSSVCAWGDPFRVAVAHPDAETADSPAEHLAIVELNDESLSVSAVSGRVLAWPDGRTGHVVDPRTGEATAAARLAAVVTGQGTVAEAWSTALLVLGPEGVAPFARNLPGGSALISRAGPDGTGTVVHGPAFTVC